MKTITFTTMHFVIAFAVAWLLTGDILVGGLVAAVEPAVNSVGYTIHEKLWRRHELKKHQAQPISPSVGRCLTC